MFNINLVNSRRAFIVAALVIPPLVALCAPFAVAQEATKQAAPVYVAMTTTKGTIYLELNAAKAPISVENFTAYAKEGYYNGTIFHRVIKSFMIQGGGFIADLGQKTTKAGIKNEWTNGLSNGLGTISMARQGGRADSATSQFFINTADNKMLDDPRDGAGYAVFGTVIKGMDVVEAIEAVPTGVNKGMLDVPKETIMIESVVIMKAPPAADAPTLRAPPAAVTPAAPATPPAPPASGTTKP